MLKQEFSEGERALNKVAQAAQDKGRELERTEAELKAKTSELSNVTGHLNKIRQQLGG